MNAKNYGQVLRDDMDNGTEFDRLSLVSDATFERCARAVILEFVRRVEERAEELERIGENKHEWGVTEDWSNLFDAFEQLSKEIKEAK